MFAEYRRWATLVSCIVGIDSRANGATHARVTVPRKRVWFGPESVRLTYQGVRQKLEDLSSAGSLSMCLH
jgi:hypothetical protein